MLDAGAPAWDAVAFDALRERVADELPMRAMANVAVVIDILRSAASIDRRLVEPAPPSLGPALDDLTGQRIALVHAGFVAAAGSDRLPDIARYLRAMERRLDDIRQGSPAIESAWPRCSRSRTATAASSTDAASDGSDDAALERIGWMIEELRVSLFAQALGTPEPISETAHRQGHGRARLTSPFRVVCARRMGVARRAIVCAGPSGQLTVHSPPPAANWFVALQNEEAHG